MASDRADAEHARSSPQPPGSEPKTDGSPSTGNGGASVSGDRKNREPTPKNTAATRNIDHAVESEDDEPRLLKRPPLPEEAAEDDGWTYIWDAKVGAYYFYNSLTGQAQWKNPRVPEASPHMEYSVSSAYDSSATALASSSGAPGTSPPPPKRPHGGYNPAIHGNYDPNADYAKEAEKDEEEAEAAAAAAAAALAAGLAVPSGEYGFDAHFNRFTGRYQQASVNPDYHNDENKSKRQMTAFFDVDAAANSHDGRSLKAERRNKALSRKELRQFKNKKLRQKEQKQRAWLRD